MGLRLKERRLLREVVDIASVNSSLARAPEETLAIRVGCKLILVFPPLFSIFRDNVNNGTADACFRSAQTRTGNRVLFRKPYAS